MCKTHYQFCFTCYMYMFTILEIGVLRSSCRYSPCNNCINMTVWFEWHTGSLAIGFKFPTVGSGCLVDECPSIPVIARRHSGILDTAHPLPSLSTINHNYMFLFRIPPSTISHHFKLLLLIFLFLHLTKRVLICIFVPMD